MFEARKAEKRPQIPSSPADYIMFISLFSSSRAEIFSIVSIAEDTDSNQSFL